jgi:nitrite reductase/ring-hydroxylating ferredoxin subunit
MKNRAALTVITVLLSFILISAISSCKKNESNSGVPYVPVNITININLPAYNALAVTGGWETVSGGSRGILIYRASPTEFVAYDRHCPYQSEKLCAVTMDSTNIIATDIDCCNTSYLLTNGSVTQGPGSLPLQAYNTTFNGTLLRIFN